MSTGALLALLALTLAASFLFSGMEAGVLGLNRLRLRQLQRQGNRRAQWLQAWLEQPEPFLWTILVGNTLANFGAAVLWVLLWQRGLAGLDWPPLARQILFWLGFLAGVFVFFYGLCDLLPKVMFRLFPTRLCLLLAPLFNVARGLLAPLVKLVTWLAEGLAQRSGGRRFTGRLFASRDELRYFVEEHASSLTTEERAMIQRVLDLQNRRVRQLAIPLSEAVTTEAQVPLREALHQCREHGVSRLPVWQGEGQARRVAGILSLRAVLYRSDLNPDKPVKDYLRPAMYLDEDLSLEAALGRMQRAGERVAIVLDARQREVGVIFLQDILRAIFGEVQL
ncbi:MAG: CNNM domain-containing protein [Verrucomicrobiae bacterium]|nr:CNNM domain-containing protein [Verrucomicrobiae bacterium]